MCVCVCVCLFASKSQYRTESDALSLPKRVGRMNMCHRRELKKENRRKAATIKVKKSEVWVMKQKLHAAQEKASLFSTDL